MSTVKHAKINAFEGQTANFFQHKRNCIRGLLWMIFMVFMVNGVNGQVYEVIDFQKRKAIADSLINELKEGALVVRLRTKHKKIVALNKVLSNKDLSKRKRKLTEKNLKTTIRDRDRFNQELVSALYEYYDFSKFYIIHDTSSLQLNNGETQGFFLNEKLEIDPSIIFSTNSYFILSEGSTDGKGLIVDGLIITSSEGDLLDSPFPRYFEVESNLNGILALFTSRLYYRYSGKRIVQKINNSLTYFAK